MEYPIYEKIQDFRSGYYYYHGKDAETLYLTRGGLVKLMHEMEQYKYCHKVSVPDTCPHCGQPTGTFMGMNIRIISDDDVFVGEHVSSIS